MKVSASGYEKERLDQLKKMRGLAEDRDQHQPRKPKKIKGVNPLAAKKKKVKNGGAFGKQTDPSKVFVLIETLFFLYELAIVQFDYKYRETKFHDSCTH